MEGRCFFLMHIKIAMSIINTGVGFVFRISEGPLYKVQDMFVYASLPTCTLYESYNIQTCLDNTV